MTFAKVRAQIFAKEANNLVTAPSEFFFYPTSITSGWIRTVHLLFLIITTSHLLCVFLYECWDDNYDFSLVKILQLLLHCRCVAGGLWSQGGGRGAGGRGWPRLWQVRGHGGCGHHDQGRPRDTRGPGGDCQADPGQSHQVLYYFINIFQWFKNTRKKDKNSNSKHFTCAIFTQWTLHLNQNWVAKLYSIQYFTNLFLHFSILNMSAYYIVLCQSSQNRYVLYLKFCITLLALFSKAYIVYDLHFELAYKFRGENTEKSIL